MAKQEIPRSRAHLQHRDLREAILAALEPVLFEPHQLDNAALRPLEAQFAKVCGRDYAYGVNSGTAGLFLALRACGVGPDHEVITVANSDISTTAAISHCGATPVLCDVRANDHTIDPQLVEALITPRTVALLPVDLYGHPADVRALRHIADKHGLRIIEDATLATGARDHGLPVGSFADAAVFSFGAYKPLGATGNGGMVVTNDSEVAAQVRLLRSYGRSLDSVPGQSMWTVHSAEGYNLPLDPLQAAIISVKLPYLAQWTTRRQEIALRYATQLAGRGVGVPQPRAESEPTFYTYVIRIPKRDQVYVGLRGRGIEVGLHYVPPVHHQPVYRNHVIAQSRLPVTEKLATELIGLPIHPDLTDDEVDTVAASVRALLDAA